MKNRTFIICFILTLTLNAIFSQQQRGVGLLHPIETHNSIKAMVIGISSYKNLPVENQLDYADDDAIAFYNFLLSKPDLIEAEDVFLFINQEATNQLNILNTLYTLITEASPDDLIILYFAGHGDVQNINNVIEKGYLLLYNVDPTDSDYAAPTNDVISINTIQEYLTYAQTGVKTLIIFDACRSGKLIEVNRAKKTLSALNEEWDNTFKLVSCQPNQSSFEGEKWGGGHGVFSYFLVYALRGLADKDYDNMLKFGEIYEFVYDSVRKEKGWDQTPVQSGSMDYDLFSVDAEMKDEALASMLNKDYALLAMNDPDETDRGSFLLQLETRNKSLLNKFYTAIEEMNYFPAGENSDKVEEIPEISVISKSSKKIAKDNLYTIAISENLKKIAISGENNEIVILDSSGMKPVSSLNCSGVMSLEFSPDGSLLVSGDWHNHLNIWDTKTYEPVKSFNNTNDIRCISFNESGDMIAAAGYGDYINIIIKNKNSRGAKKDPWVLLSNLDRKHSKRIKTIAFYQNDKLISGGEDQKLFIRDINDNQIIKDIKYNSEVNDIEIIPNYKKIAIALNDGSVYVYAYDSFEQLDHFQVNTANIDNIEASENGRYIFISGKGRELLVYDLLNQGIVEKIMVPRGISDMNYDESNETLCYSMYGGHIGVTRFLNTAPLTAKTASEIFEKLMDSNASSSVNNRLKSYFTTVFLDYSNNILDDLINGKSKTPSLHEIQEAESYLLYISKYYNFDDRTKQADLFILNRIDVSLKLLNIYKTLIQNDYTNINESIQTLKALSEKCPDAAYTHNTLSVAYRMLNQYQDSKNSALISSEKVPTWSEPIANLGKAYAMEYSYQKALLKFNELITNLPEKNKGYLLKSNLISSLGNQEEARNLLDLSLKNGLPSSVYYYRKAIIEIRNSSVKEAYNSLNLSMNEDSTILELMFVKSKLLHYEFIHSDIARKRTKYNMINNNLYESMQGFIEIYNANPDYQGLKSEIAYLLYSLHKESSYISKEFNDKTKELFSKNYRNIGGMTFLTMSKIISLEIINENPDEYLAAYVYALCQDELNLSNSLEYLTDLDEFSLDHHLFYYYRGKYFLESDNMRKAKSEFEKSLEINPDFIPAIYNYSQTLKSKQQRNSFINDLNNSLLITNSISEIFLDNGMDRSTINRSLIEKVCSDRTIYFQHFYKIF